MNYPGIAESSGARKQKISKICRNQASLKPETIYSTISQQNIDTRTK